jgi:hypothetical protein
MQQTKTHYDWLTNPDRHKQLLKSNKKNYSALDKINKPVVTKQALKILDSLKP